MNIESILILIILFIAAICAIYLFSDDFEITDIMYKLIIVILIIVLIVVLYVI